MKHHPYALRIPTEDAKELAKAQEISGQSINQLVMLCVRKALPDVLANFRPGQRVTTVQPLSVSELRRIYSGKDELEGITAKELSGFQSQREPQ